ncbi:MAG: hypothetical protein WDM91_20510 [Rhizomicrobium sp.]
MSEKPEDVVKVSVEGLRIAWQRPVLVKLDASAAQIANSSFIYTDAADNYS